MSRFGALLVAAALTLSACGGDVHSAPINAELFDNPQKVAKISNRLEPAERELFGRYVLSRTVGAAFGGKPIVNAAGKDPATVGEAIELMKAARDKEARRAALRAEMKAKYDVLAARRAALEQPMIDAGYAPGPTQAFNAVGEEMNQLQADYAKRIAAIK